MAKVSVLFWPAAFQRACGRGRGHSPALAGFFIYRDLRMDKLNREALQVAKELTCKFIETRTVSPGNFAEVFPIVFKVVAQTIREGCAEPSD